MSSPSPSTSTSKKIPFYGRRYTPRTTTGCITCRQRRLKCDETKPACTRCTNLDLECVYRVQIRWPTEGAKLGNNRIRQSRRKVASSPDGGHRGVSLSPSADTASRNSPGGQDVYDSSSGPLAKTSPSSVHEWSEAEEQVLHLTEFSRKDRRLDSCIPFVRSLDYSLPHMTNDDRLLFDFYASKMCPRCMVRNGNNNNNYRQVVLPLVYQSSLLLKTVLAVAANRLKLHNGSYQTVALRYQNLVLKGLQQSLVTQKRTWFSRIEILSIVLMLCFFEDYDPIPGPTTDDQNGMSVPLRPWVTHSQGIRHLLEEDKDSTQQDTQYEQAILSFHSQYFVSRSILTYTAMMPHEDHESILQSALYWLDMADRPDNEINPFAGCSNELLRLILTITYQLRHQRQSRQDYDDYEWAEKARAQLLSIEQYSPRNTQSSVFDGISGHHRSNGSCSGGASVEQTAESFRLATLLLLENIPNNQSESRKAEYLSQLFQLLQSGIYIPESGKLGSSSYFWPCFVAGCHLRCPEQQASMLEHVASLTSDCSSVPTGNAMAQQIQNTLVHVWTFMRDYHMTSVLIDDGDGNTRFVWETISLLGNCAFEWV